MSYPHCPRITRRHTRTGIGWEVAIQRFHAAGMADGEIAEALNFLTPADMAALESGTYPPGIEPQTGKTAITNRPAWNVRWADRLIARGKHSHPPWWTRWQVWYWRQPGRLTDEGLVANRKVNRQSEMASVRRDGGILAQLSGWPVDLGLVQVRVLNALLQGDAAASTIATTIGVKRLTARQLTPLVDRGLISVTGSRGSPLHLSLTPGTFPATYHRNKAGRPRSIFDEPDEWVEDVGYPEGYS